MNRSLSALFPLLLFLTGPVSATTTTTAMDAVGALPRPRVMMTPERLTGLREEIRNPGWKRDVYLRTVRANADLWVDRSIRIPARGGWIMNFVCTDGTMLPIPENQDFGSTTTYSCSACGVGYSGPRFEAARRRLEHEWLMAAARDLAMAGVLENDSRYLRQSVAILLGYADARFPGHDSSGSAGIFRQSLNDAVAIIWLAQAYDLLASIDGVLSPDDQRRIERDVLWESAEGLTRCGLSGNWGSWHLSAVGVIGLATGHEGYIAYADRAFRQQMKHELGSDGLWPESIHYHFYALQAFIEYAEAAANCGTDLYRFEAGPGQGLHAMFNAPLSLMYPDLQMPAINDGFVTGALPFDQYEAAWARYGDPQFAWLLKQRPRTLTQRARGARTPSAIRALVHGDPLPDNIPTPRFPATNFAHLGTGVLRNDSTLPLSEQIMVTFDYGRMMSHGQFDKMGISLFAAGRLMAADYGTPAYGSAISPWYSRSLSHNTVVINGGSQAATSSHGLLFFQDAPGLTAACAETTEALPGTHWRRTVILDHGLSEPHVIVVDELQSTAPQRYDWSFHSEGESFTPHGVSALRSEPASGADFHFLSDLKTCSPTSGAIRAEWRFPDGSGLTAVTAPADVTELSTARFPAESATRRIPGIILSRNTTGTTYAVVLKPVSPDTTTPTTTAPPPVITMPHPGIITVTANSIHRTYHINSTEVRASNAP